MQAANTELLDQLIETPRFGVDPALGAAARNGRAALGSGIK